MPARRLQLVRQPVAGPGPPRPTPHAPRRQARRLPLPQLWWRLAGAARRRRRPPPAARAGPLLSAPDNAKGPGRPFAPALVAISLLPTDPAANLSANRHAVR